MSANRRKFRRLKVQVPVSCHQLDNPGRSGPQNPGVVLDVSLGGLLLKSLDFISSEFVSVSFVDINHQVAQIKCKMAYSRKTDKGLVHTGLMFQGSKQERLDFVTRMIRVYFYREKKASRVSPQCRPAPPPQA